MPLFATVPARHHQPRGLQYPQMLHHSEAGHVQLALELLQRPPVRCEQAVEQKPAGGIGQRLEHAVGVFHRPIIGDQLVTCQDRLKHLRSHGAAQPPPTEPRADGTADAAGTLGGTAERDDRAAGGTAESDPQLALCGTVVARRRLLPAGAGRADQRPPDGADRTSALDHPPGVGGRLPGASAGAAARDHALVERQLSPPARGRRHRPAGGGRPRTGGRAAAHLRRVGSAALAALRRTRPAGAGHGRARRGGAGAGSAARRVGGVRTRPAHLGGGLAGTAAEQRRDRRRVGVAVSAGFWPRHRQGRPDVVGTDPPERSGRAARGPSFDRSPTSTMPSSGMCRTGCCPTPIARRRCGFCPTTTTCFCLMPTAAA